MFTHVKLYLAAAIHNLRWVKIIQNDKIKVNDFEILLIDVTFSGFIFDMFKSWY